jgi:hypothetical protein
MNNLLPRKIIEAAFRLYAVFHKAHKTRGIFSLALRVSTILQSEGLNGIRIRLSIFKHIAVSEYQKWIDLHERFDESSKAFVRLKIDSLKNPQVISVLMPTCDSNIVWLREAIESVRGQLTLPLKNVPLNYMKK